MLVVIRVAVAAVATAVYLMAPRVAPATPVPRWTAEALTYDDCLQSTPSVWGDYVA
jgi:hypothetical protein